MGGLLLWWIHDLALPQPTTGDAMLVQTQWTASCLFLSLEPICVVSAQASPQGLLEQVQY